MRKFIEDSWNSYPNGISLQQMNSYGCNYMAIINKTSKNYGTIILTGYEDQYSALIVGAKYSTAWRWSRTNMTNF